MQVAGDYHFTPTLIIMFFSVGEPHLAYKSNNLFQGASSIVNIGPLQDITYALFILKGNNPPTGFTVSKYSSRYEAP